MVTYTGEQYLGAYTLLQSLVDRDDLRLEDVQDAIFTLNQLGFEPMPFNLDLQLDENDED